VHTALAFILSLVLVSHAQSQTIEPGFQLIVRPAAGLADSEFSTFRDRLELQTIADFGGIAAPFDAKVIASVHCDQEDEYEFRIVSDEPVVFTIDDARFSSDVHATKPMSVRIPLATGTHRIVIEKRETGGEAKLSVEWKSTQQTEFRTLDSTSLRAEWVSPRVLVFSKTAGFRHDSIPEGIEMLRNIANRRRMELVSTEDSAIFTDENLKNLDAVIFLNTTGDVLDKQQEAAFETFIRHGGGYIGIHSASDTEYDWPFYADLVGAYFNSHPAIQDADVIVREPRHVTTMHLPSKWRRRDEWYDFRAAPKLHVNRILELDEATYQGGKMNGDHPVAWWHLFHGSRAIYCAMGHTKESYAEPAFIEFIERSVLWSCRRIDSAPSGK